jgi:hypothetical protein
MCWQRTGSAGVYPTCGECSAEKQVTAVGRLRGCIWKMAVAASLCSAVAAPGTASASRGVGPSIWFGSTSGIAAGFCTKAPGLTPGYSVKIFQTGRVVTWDISQRYPIRRLTAASVQSLVRLAKRRGFFGIGSRIRDVSCRGAATTYIRIRGENMIHTVDIYGYLDSRHPVIRGLLQALTDATLAGPGHPMGARPGRPPSVWLSVGQRTIEASLGSYCWGGVCVDMASDEALLHMATASISSSSPLAVVIGSLRIRSIEARVHAWKNPRAGVRPLVRKLKLVRTLVGSDTAVTVAPVRERGTLVLDLFVSFAPMVRSQNPHVVGGDATYEWRLSSLSPRHVAKRLFLSARASVSPAGASRRE